MRSSSPLDSLLKAGTYTLVAIGFAALWTGRAFGAPVAAPFIVAALVSWFVAAPAPRLARLWTPLTVVFIVLSIALAATGVLLTIEAGVLFVVYLTAAKLFNRDRLADTLQLLALSFLLLAAATAFNSDLIFGVFFAGYVLVGVVTFALYHLRLQLEDNDSRGGQRVQHLFGAGYAGILSAMAVFVFAMSLVFFFLFPRLGFGFFVSKHRPGIATTGFSSRVDLGTYGQIKTDNRVVMRVEFPGGALPPVDQRYFRGMAFDHYDGRAWSRTTPPSRRLVARPPDWDYEITEGVSPAERAGAFRQKIYLEPLDAPVLFGMPEILTVSLLDKDKGPTMWLRGREIAVTSTGDVEHKTKGSMGFAYQVRSQVDPPPVHALRSVESSAVMGALGRTLTRKYLQLPHRLDPRVRRLARDVTKDATNDYDRAAAIERYLMATYTYTTDLPNVGDTPPLEAFLFDTRRGHCEFFASAMVIMLRTLGIAARSVNGFRGGQWNDFDDFLAVRNADAHSWVEVYLGPRRWITFDPTPMASDVSSKHAWYAPAAELYDSLKFKWLKYVIEYDLETQVEFLRQASEAFGADPDSVKAGTFGWTLTDLLVELKRNAVPSLLVVFAVLFEALVIGLRGRQRRFIDLLWVAATVCAGAAIVVALWRPEPTLAATLFGTLFPLAAGLTVFAAKHARHRGPVTPRVTAIATLYLQLRELAVQRGLSLSRADGPAALIALTRAADLEGAAVIERVVRRYMEVRFGGADLADTELRQLKRAVTGLRKRSMRSARSSESS